MPQYQTGSTCVNDTLAAANYQANQNDGSIVLIGTAQYVTSVTSVSATAIVYKFTNVSSTAVVNKTVTPTFQNCSQLSTVDAAALAWKVVIVWVAAYAIKVIARAVSSDYGAQI
jgi:hypothetical protein